MGSRHSAPSKSQDDDAYKSRIRAVSAKSASVVTLDRVRTSRSTHQLRGATSRNCQTRSITYEVHWCPQLTVVLRLDRSGQVDAFCVHLSCEANTTRYTGHTFFELKRSHGPPRRLYCFGRQPRICYVVAREIYTLLIAGVRSPETLNTRLSKALSDIGSRCFICRSKLGAACHRPTRCSSQMCLQEYLTASLNIRLEDFVRDRSAVGLLLASVRAAVTRGNAGLLPGWPATRLNVADAGSILDSFPALSSAFANSDMTSILRSHVSDPIKATQAELLLSWIATRFRGSITAANRAYLLPGMDGTAQFVVVDSQPETKAAYASHKRLSPRRILYHGTSIDRLYAVLVQGLQILSGTPLAQHGAAYGSGIYMARQPHAALSYARTNIPATQTPIPYLRGDAGRARLLLACEHAGNDTSTSRSAPKGIHVIQDPTRVMVRYIFIVPEGARMPQASQLNASILESCKHLEHDL